MRKFKLFFYPVYILLALVVLYYSIDVLSNMDAYREKLDFALLRKLPAYVLYAFLALSLLMITEMVTENFHIINLKNRLRRAEKELLSLKARLYDQSREEGEEDDDGDEEEDDKGEGDRAV